MPFITIILFGALAGSLALIIELPMMNLSFFPVTLEGTFSSGILLSFLLLAIIEELSKYIFLFRYRRYILYENTLTLSLSLLSAILFGIGFSSLEIIFASQNTTTVSLFPIMRTLSLHIGTSLLFIYSLFRLPQQNRLFTLKSFWIISGAVLFHLLYNILIFLIT
ncbi:MAG: hypothetical protein COZ29_01535 [Candidatus Moranbacteria bacterium CG_4_10_14_3_um_filter_45_9]|nr:MAG: hypothetical protein COZ29_01535 [Candidatus Moranbacteria bacterium CG_4_10_14_3_um_filter_45_9]PJA85144.1 MAG: hypothetical protein CO143_02730 [Candidatus Moranbacteria bacterium CG_4_9_14_3_um_filter_45_14]